LTPEGKIPANGGNITYYVINSNGSRVISPDVNTAGYATKVVGKNTESSPKDITFTATVQTGNQTATCQLTKSQLRGLSSTTPTTLPALLPAPTNATARKRNDCTVLLNFSPVVGATKYRVSRGTGTPDGPYDLFAWIDITTTTNNGSIGWPFAHFSPGVRYYFKISALNASNQPGAESNPVGPVQVSSCSPTTTQTVPSTVPATTNAPEEVELKVRMEQGTVAQVIDSDPYSNGPKNSGNKINCPGKCSANFAPRSPVKLRIDPSRGYQLNKHSFTGSNYSCRQEPKSDASDERGNGLFQKGNLLKETYWVCTLTLSEEHTQNLDLRFKKQKEVIVEIDKSIKANPVSDPDILFPKPNSMIIKKPGGESTDVSKFSYYIGYTAQDTVKIVMPLPPQTPKKLWKGCESSEEVRNNKNEVVSTECVAKLSTDVNLVTLSSVGNRATQHTTKAKWTLINLGSDVSFINGSQVYNFYQTNSPESECTTGLCRYRSPVGAAITMEATAASGFVNQWRGCKPDPRDNNFCSFTITASGTRVTRIETPEKVQPKCTIRLKVSPPVDNGGDFVLGPNGGTIEGYVFSEDGFINPCSPQFAKCEFNPFTKSASGNYKEFYFELLPVPEYRDRTVEKLIYYEFETANGNTCGWSVLQLRAP